MKKFSILLLSAILLITALAFTSCDQQAVDDALNNLMDASADAFEPVFNKAESSTESSGTPDIEPSDDEEESEEVENPDLIAVPW